MQPEVIELLCSAIEFPVPERFPIRPCIYFLISGDEVLYVGQTACLPRRVQEHLAGKSFNRVLFLDVPFDRLDAAERMAIELIRPRLNRSMNPDRMKFVLEEYVKYGTFNGMPVDRCVECGMPVNPAWQCGCGAWIHRAQIKLCSKCHESSCGKD